MRLNPWLLMLFVSISTTASAQLGSPLQEESQQGLVTFQKCDTLDVVITHSSRYASSFRSVSLDSATNSWLDYPSAPLYGDTTFFYRAVAFDRTLPASGVIVLADRSGNSVRVPFRWTPPTIHALRELHVTGAINESKDTILSLTNTGKGHDTIVSIEMAGRKSEVSLFGAPTNMITLPPGETVMFGVRLAPNVVGTVHDTILVNFQCSALRIPVGLMGTGTVSVEWEAASRGMRLSAAPNPASERAQITLRGFTGATTVDVVDGAGKLVERLMERGNALEGTVLEWSADGIPPGTYYCVVQSGSGRQTTQIVVSR